MIRDLSVPTQIKKNRRQKRKPGVEPAMIWEYSEYYVQAGGPIRNYDPKGKHPGKLIGTSAKFFKKQFKENAEGEYEEVSCHVVKPYYQNDNKEKKRVAMRIGLGTRKDLPSLRGSLPGVPAT